LNGDLRHTAIVETRQDAAVTSSSPEWNNPHVLPNLIVIGAAKCGTTSLHRYLDLHPEICMAKAKELNFFVEDENWRRGLGWYEAQFRPAPIRGETSPLYSYFPSRPGVPKRMAAVVPETRLVYLVRDPIDRLISSYRFGRWVANRNHGDIEDELADLENSRFVSASCYAMQLDQYLPRFDSKQFCVVDSSDLQHRAADTMARVFRFLGVDDSFTSDAFGKRHYATEELYAASSLGRATKSLAYRVLGRSRARLLRLRTPERLLRPFLVRPEIPEITIDASLRARLEAYFGDDVDRLRALTGQRFETWSV
jgi:hypothetical protein